jgi:Na+-driven multidrug efflux pump
VFGFLPLTWLSLVFGWGLVGIWSGLTAFVGLRLILGIWRVTSGRWKVSGTG